MQDWLRVEKLEAYGLTAEEVDLLWKSAPPGMPRFP